MDTSRGLARCYAVIVLIAAIIANSAIASDDKQKEELKQLMGRWEVVEMHWNGSKLKHSEQSHLYWEIKESITIITLRPLREGEKGAELKFNGTIDPGTGFSYIDLDTNNPKLGFRGIYKLEKDELSVCIRAGCESRPASFETDHPEKFKLILKRSK